MLEDYGTLSEEELLQEILEEIKDKNEINTSELEFKFAEGQLIIAGTLKNEKELKHLVDLLENFLDPKEYELEIELHSGNASNISKSADYEKELESEADSKYFKDELDEIDDDEDMSFDDDADFGDDKW